MRKNLLIGIAVLLLLGLLAASAGAWIVFSSNTETYEEPRSLYIPRGAEFEQIVDSLNTRDIIASAATFSWMAKLTGWGAQIDAGHYRIPSGASNYNILSKLRRGEQDPVRVTIPPGTRPEVVAAVAARDMAFPADSFLAALNDTSLARSLGTDTTHLFGYMLPETYSFYWLTSEERVITRIKEHFDNFFTAEMAARADSLGLTTDEVVSLAAIVQWETSLNSEKPRVAGVYLNRLRIGMALQADPTVQYALLETEGQKRRLRYVDYDIEHPYNTYNFRGLPPGPITNPSASSIRAVVNAEDHDYLYFVANIEGGHTFNETLRAHNRDARAFHRALDRRNSE